MRTVTSEWLRLRWETLERDNFTCQYCGRRAPDVQLQVDHKIAVVDGGTDDPENLATACFSCNQGKEYTRWSTEQLAATKAYVQTRPNVRRKVRAPSKTSIIASLLENDPAMSDEELADATGVTVGSAHVIRYRIKARLKV